MLKYRKNLVAIRINTFLKVSIPVLILVPYNIIIKEILDKLKKFVERNIKNILKM